MNTPTKKLNMPKLNYHKVTIAGVHDYNILRMTITIFQSQETNHLHQIVSNSEVFWTSN